MHEQELRARLEQVRRQWLLAEGAQALAKALGAAALLVLGVWLLAWGLPLKGRPLVVAVGLGVCAVVGLLGLAVRPFRATVPLPRLARFIEERLPELDDRLVSAVEVLEHPGASPFEGLVVRDAAARLATSDPDRIVSSQVVRRRVMTCGAAAVALLVSLILARVPFATAARTAWYGIFPSTLTIQVQPGNVRLRAGEPFRVTAVLSGRAADLAAELGLLRVGHGDAQRVLEATADGITFRWDVASLDESLDYQVAVGDLESAWYRVEALHPAKVTQIDVSYVYPSFSGLAPRTEEDTGDIYAPQGTNVTLSVVTDKPVSSAKLTLADGGAATLAAGGDGKLTGRLLVSADSAYRVALVDTDGLENPGDTEYFIRVMDDRPPEVKVSRPAGDRQVTRLEEVAIEARADDDYGIDQLELVYAVSGQTEKVVPLHRGKASTTVTGRDVLFVEDLDVKPGDFVTYYARARDVGRGKSPSVAQSDIFFLDVRPFSEEFIAAQSQAGGGNAMSGGQLEELIKAQKDIIVATWKIERRAAAGRSVDDVHAIEKAQADVRKRTAQAAGEAGPGAGRRRPAVPGQPPTPDALADPLQRAVESMGQAQTALAAVKTSAAIPHEMEALNRLLEAQAENTRRQVTQQNGNGGNGPQGQNQDLSALFDRELLRQTETNYETEKSSSAREEQEGQDNALDKLRELARRQDDLARQQRELAKRQEDLAREDLKRQLERLTREQAELRQQAERLAEQLSREAEQSADGQPRQDADQAAANNPGQVPESQTGDEASPKESSSGQQASGQQSAGQQSSGQQSSGRQSAQGQRRPGQGQPRPSQQANGRPGTQGQGQSEQLRQASEQMRNATGDLRRSELQQAAERSQQAAEQLRELERELQARQPDEQRRQLGELQLEARQLAESQRRLGGSPGQQGGGNEGDADARRRAAGEQRRLAERAEQLEQALGRTTAPDAAGRQALSEALKEMGQRRVADRMREVADALGGAGNGRAPSPSPSSPRAQQQELASALDRVADKVSTALGRDTESRALSEKLADLRGLRERLSELERKMDDAAQRGAASARAASKEEASKPGSSAEKGQQASQEPGQRGSSKGDSREGDPGSPGGDATAELGQLQEAYARELRQTETLLDQLRQENSSIGGELASLEQHYYSRSAPGTEAFKQDFARWDILRRDVQQALERLEGSLANRLAERDSKQRVHVGGDDPQPESYRKQISDYYRSITKRPGGSS